MQIYDRLQCHCAILLIPIDYFVADNSGTEDMQTSSYDTPNIYLIIEHERDTWINVKILNCQIY